MTKKTTALFVIAASTIVFTSGVRAQKPGAAGAGQHEQMMKGMMGMTDAMFVPTMIKHHHQGIEMARLEEDRGSSASVKALAAKIRQSQEKELAAGSRVEESRLKMLTGQRQELAELKKELAAHAPPK